MKAKIQFAAICLFWAFCAVSCSSVRTAELHGSDFLSLLRDMPKHDSFNYVTWNSLEGGAGDYFDEVEKTLEDPSVYLVISNTKSAASKLIGIFTGDDYNHVSLSFDREMRTLVSYNGGNGRGNPGLNRETLDDLHQSPSARVAVYRLPVEIAEKQVMINEVRRINNEGSSYNLLGLFIKHSFKPNIMFCSQFVYTLLSDANICHFTKESAKMKPMDFLDLPGSERIMVADYLVKSKKIEEISKKEKNLKKHLIIVVV
jgi:hypothetical protein